MNSQLLKGHSELLVMTALDREPMHGYALSQKLQDQAPEMFKFGVGMLYPLLHKLEKQRFIEGLWSGSGKERRKIYALTKNGKKNLESRKKEWASFAAMMKTFVENPR